MSLAHKAIRETVVLSLLSNAKFGIRLLANLILARLLAPHDFGVVVLAMSILNFINLEAMWGIEASLVQKKGDDQQLDHTIFTITIIFSVFLCLTAPPILYLLSAYYHPEVIKIIIVCLFPYVIKILSSVSLGTMIREMLLKKMGWIELVSVTLASLIGITAAWAGGGIWSLVLFYGLLNIFPAVGYFLYSPYAPKIGWHKEKAKWFFSFGSKVFASSLLTELVSEGDNIALGSIAGSAALGIYNLAWKLSYVFQPLFFATLSRAALSTFSRQDIPRANKARAFEFVSRNIFRFVLPFHLLLALLSTEIVLVVLGKKWLGSAPLLVLLLPYSMIMPFYSLNRQFHLAVGKPENLLNMLKIILPIFALLLIPLVYLLRAWGAALTLNITWLIGIGILYQKTRKVLPVHLGKSVLPIFAAALLPAGTLWYWVHHLAPASPLTRIIFGGGLYLCIYLGLLFLFETRKLQSDLMEIKRSLFEK